MKRSHKHTNTMDKEQNSHCETAPIKKVKENLLCENATKILITSGIKLSEVFSRVQGGNLNVIHLHFQGVTTHYVEILASVVSNNIDVIFISKTWFTSVNSCNEIDLPGYTLIRNDKEEDCGGVAIYLRECFGYNIVDQSSNKCAMSAEHLLIEITYEGIRVLLGMFYCSSPKLNYFPHFKLLLQRHRLQYEHFICFGDFKTDLLKNNKRSNKLLAIIDDQNLFLLPVAETLVAPNVAPTISDLVLVSSPDNVTKSGHFGGCCPYHKILYLSYRL